MCVSVRVRVCVRERERERDKRKRGRERERERGAPVFVPHSESLSHPMCTKCKYTCTRMCTKQSIVPYTAIHGGTRQILQYMNENGYE